MTKKEFKRRIGERIVKLREEKGWTQSDLARAANKDRQAIHKIEKGSVNPTAFTLWELSDTLDLSLSELVAI